MNTLSDEAHDGAEAERIVEDARGRADELLTEARREAESIRAEARREVIEEIGQRLEDELHDTVSAQVRAFETACEALLKQISEEADRRLAGVERELTGLICTMAGKVLRRKIAEDDRVVHDVVQATVAEAAGAKRFTVRVAADAEDAVRAAQAELLRAADGPEQLEIVADDAIDPGGCIVETERGRFDARISSQLELLGEEIGRVLGE